MTARDDALTALRATLGAAYGPSNWTTVDQTMIDQFGAVTHDDQFIHVDPERAAGTELGGPIAHGFLTLSLCSRFTYDCFEDLPGQRMGINYGFDKLRFLAPVRPGHRVRGLFTLTAVEARGEDALLRTVALHVEIEGQDKPALVADWLALLLFD